MKCEDTVIKGQKKLRKGYTTGTCAAAAAKAAAWMVLSGEEIREVKLTVPAKVTLFLEVEEIRREKDVVFCAVRKDAGDDPDVTHGILVCAEVRKETKSHAKLREVQVRLKGGEGVGRVTKPGLEQPVGEYAINRTPRMMIAEAVKEMAEEQGFFGTLTVTISIPEGRETAKKTMNPRLGIVDGLSILGTTGLVEPMGEQALTRTIELEMNMRKEDGATVLCLVPGNYGSEFLEEKLGIRPEYAVKCSNYVGDALDMAVVLGFQKVLLVGHIGKFVKLAAGIWNTHSRIADGRVEIFLSVLAELAWERGKRDPEGALDLLSLVPEFRESVTTDEMLSILERIGMRESILERMMERITWNLGQRTRGQIETGLVMFSRERGLLGQTGPVEELIGEIQTKEKGGWR